MCRGSLRGQAGRGSRLWDRMPLLSVGGLLRMGIRVPARNLLKVRLSLSLSLSLNSRCSRRRNLMLLLLIVEDLRRILVL